MEQSNIRNFCIVAHVDHGKSTLADRMLELTHTVAAREMKEQLLDQMDLERERGITIKLAPVRMIWESPESKSPKVQESRTSSESTFGLSDFRTLDSNSEQFVLNLIDTPGHVDFSYEVSRSLAAVEGAILLVDASQGIEAQTLSTLYAAMEHNLAIIPVVNKIDSPAARPEEVAADIVKLLGCAESEVLFASGKTGQGVKEILDAIVERVPQPSGNQGRPAKALIFDSVYDPFRGVVAYVRVVDGSLKNHDEILLMQTKCISRVEETGTFSPKFIPRSPLFTGEIGYVVTGFREVSEARVGDTVTLKNQPADSPLPGYKQVKPFVFASIFCIERDQYQELKEGIGKLKMNDAALTFEPEQSEMLGHGFRCGFLGLLHMDIVRERLEREFDLDLIITSPTVVYKASLASGGEVFIGRASDFKQSNVYSQVYEPWATLEIVTPKEYIGGIMDLCQSKRAIYKNTEYLDEERIVLHYEMPLSELIVNFYDQLKSISHGYASLNYDMADLRPTKVEKIEIMIADEKVDALSFIVFFDRAQKEARRLVERLKELIPKQNFEVKIQAANGASIIASERISALRKDVIAKLYGGDVTRKNKLLEKQKKGKKKMRQIGKVNIPSDVFLRVLKNE